jgi:preprotein translocase subunit SecF
MRWFHNTNIDFVGKRTAFLIVSVCLSVFGIVSVILLGINYKIDFTGGTEIAVRFSQNINTEQIRKCLNKTTLSDAEIKSYGKENQFLIRVKEFENASNIIIQSVEKNYPDNKITILKVDKIGPKVGKELRGQAFMAIFLSVIAMLIYLAFRFEFIFGLGAIIALVHDVIITFTLIIFVGHTGLINLEVGQDILAAMLTVVGYSVNDTVIIFDRIRENRDKHKGKSFEWMCNMSINETLSRTVNTVATVLLTLLIMVFFGGPVLQGFAFTMLLGIIFGTYSSVYVASSFVIWYLEKVHKVDVQKGSSKKELTGTAKA